MIHRDLIILKSIQKIIETKIILKTFEMLILNIKYTQYTVLFSG